MEKLSICVIFGIVVYHSVMIGVCLKRASEANFEAGVQKVAVEKLKGDLERAQSLLRKLEFEQRMADKNLWGRLAETELRLDSIDAQHKSFDDRLSQKEAGKGRPKQPQRGEK